MPSRKEGKIERRFILKNYLIVSWWRKPLPKQDQRDCTPQVEEVSSEDMAKEKARKKKRKANPKEGISENRVLIAEVIEEL